MAKLYRYKELTATLFGATYCIEWSMDIVQPKNGTDFSLEELRGFVGGHIEIVPLTKNRLMIVDEEGKLKGLPLNLVATEIYNKESFCSTDTICGNALVCKRSEVR